MSIKNLRDTNDEMRKHTEGLKRTAMKMDDKSSLMFGVRAMETVINTTLVADNAEDVTKPGVSKYLSAEDYKKLLLAEINIVQAFENLQNTYIDLIEIAQNNRKNSKEDNSEDADVDKLGDILLKHIIKKMEE